METLATLVSFLDHELDNASFQDASHNGLQVENSGSIKRICCGVDASMSFFQAAHAHQADMVICHHGLSWGDSLSRITELNYQRLRFLINNDMALYACHLPLDAHPVYGNNAIIADILALQGKKPFGEYHGQVIGISGRLCDKTPYENLKSIVSEKLACLNMQSMDFGKNTVKTVAVVSGGAADMVTDAGRQDIDVLITGEPSLSAYSVAEEYGVNVIFAGHYATEIFGVRALGKLLETHFPVTSDFIPMGIPY